MQNVHLLQVHIQRNRAWLRKHTEGQELRSQVEARAEPKPRRAGIKWSHLGGERKARVG